MGSHQSSLPVERDGQRLVCGEKLIVSPWNSFRTGADDADLDRLLPSVGVVGISRLGLLVRASPSFFLPGACDIIVRPQDVVFERQVARAVLIRRHLVEILAVRVLFFPRCEVLRPHGSQDHGVGGELVDNKLGNSTHLVLIVPLSIRIPPLLRERPDLLSREGLPCGGSVRRVALFGSTERERCLSETIRARCCLTRAPKCIHIVPTLER